MELEPESLNWTQSLRDLGTYYNNFVNRLGDNFLFTFILETLILFTSILHQYQITFQRKVKYFKLKMYYFIQ